MWVSLTAILALTYAVLFAWKRVDYRRLRQKQEDILAIREGVGRLRVFDILDLPSFESGIVKIDGLLLPETLSLLQRVVARNFSGERVHIPVHKRGVTVSYEVLHHAAPEIIALYHSAELHALCAKIIGERIMATPIHDQSSCSVLLYDRGGDHIGWHHDLNFYRGRHFTGLLSLINENREGRLSSAELMVRTGSGEFCVATPPNSFVLFEGARVLHKVTPLGETEKRVILSMTFSTDPTANLLQSAGRRFKDIAYYGVRALWT
jgi:hypothetical protein